MRECINYEEEYERDMEEQEWDDDHDYTRRDPNLDPGFRSESEVNGMFFRRNW